MSLIVPERRMNVRSEAADLNRVIRENNPEIFSALSVLGKNAFSPKNGIIAQSCEARQNAYFLNATIGIATQENGAPLVHPLLADCLDKLGLSEESCSYASSGGLPELIKIFAGDVPVNGAKPLITAGLSHALSLAGLMYVDPGDAVLIHSWFWENYEGLFETTLNADLFFYRFFNEDKNGFNVEGCMKALRDLYLKHERRKVILPINSPNNPTGYTLNSFEIQKMRKQFFDLLEVYEDLTVVLIADEAYFGMTEDPLVASEPIMSFFYDVHPRLVTVGAKGATKEEFFWGARTGCVWNLPFGMDSDVVEALNAKMAGITRFLISMPPVLSQYILMKIKKDPDYELGIQQNKAIIFERMSVAKKITKELGLSTFPWQSAYFFMLRTDDSERLRNELMQQYGIGTITSYEYNGIVLGGEQGLRLATSCMPVSKIPEALNNIALCQQLNSVPETIAC